ncbi:FHA domain-containing protein [Candidatus Nitrospira bockiana]
MSHAKLRVVLLSRAEEELPLEQGELTIGRAPDNHLILGHADVSDYHARLVRVGSTFYLEDVGSAEGTYVNGVRVDEQPLMHRDRIRIGPQLLIFEHMESDGSPDTRDRDRAQFDARERAS